MDQKEKDALIAKMNKLKRAYDSYLVGWRDELENYLQTAPNWTIEDTERLQILVNKLTTTGTTYGYPNITDAARALEYKIAFANVSFKSGGQNPNQNGFLMSDLKNLARLCAETYAEGEAHRQQGVLEETLYDFEEELNHAKEILIVDDREIIHLTLGGALKEAGYEVMIAADDKDAIEKMQRHMPDLVVCDRKLSHVDGMLLLRSMRKTPNWAKIPVILLTEAYDPTDILQAEKLGNVDFVAKPFDMDEFVMRCIRLFKGR